MAGRYFGIPFATTGDKTVTPDAVQPDGSVSYSEGFGFDYERPNTDPAYKPVPRDGMNGLFYDITEAIGIVQKQGFADWTIAAAPYPINAFVRHNDIVWRNTVANNNGEPGVSGWSDVSNVVEEATQSQAEAGTAQGAYSSPLRVFQSLRSAAANATELLRGTLRIGTQVEVDAGTLDSVAVTPAKLAAYPKGGFGIGVGQTWQNVMASRVAGTTYTNTENRSIEVLICISDAGNSGWTIDIGTNTLTFTNPGAGTFTHSFIVPPGETYGRLILNGNILSGWLELRS